MKHFKFNNEYMEELLRVIKKSISVRDKLYKEMIKAKNDQIKRRKLEIYKTYRNKIVDFCWSAENVIIRNISKKIRKALELSGKAFMILSILEKVKRTILLVPY